MWPELGQPWSDFDRPRPNLAKHRRILAQHRANLARHLHNLSRCWPSSFGQNLTRARRKRRLGIDPTQCGTASARCGEWGALSAKLRPASPKSGPTSAMMLTTSGQGWPTFSAKVGIWARRCSFHARPVSRRGTYGRGHLAPSLVPRRPALRSKSLVSCFSAGESGRQHSSRFLVCAFQRGARAAWLAPTSWRCGSLGLPSISIVGCALPSAACARAGHHLVAARGKSLRGPSRPFRRATRPPVLRAWCATASGRMLQAVARF